MRKHIVIKPENGKYELYVVCGEFSCKIKNVNCKTFKGAVRSAKAYAKLYNADFNEDDNVNRG